jgi:hypothetical protein
MNYNDEDEVYNDDLLEEFVMPPLEERRVVLQILDSSGDIEDILIDIEEIYKYVKALYEKCPERN